MAAEEILTLFDLYWFEYAVFAGKPLLQTKHATISSGEGIQEPENHFQSPIMQVIQVRSQSEYLFSSNFSSPETTYSTVTNSKLQSILSGKEVTEFSENGGGRKLVELPIGKKMAGREMNRRKRGGSSLSKSLSDLEFEELKGFMDLGFVFSEEDKNSSLVSIIPGLQRLGRKTGENEEEKEGKKEEKVNETVVQRPYLSEAWDVLDQENEQGSLMNWRVPALGTTEMDMKDHLRFWAHTVASTVR